jgi:hypothetical protein
MPEVPLPDPDPARVLEWDPLAWQLQNNTGTYVEPVPTAAGGGHRVVSMLDRERRGRWQLPPS